MSGGVQGGEVVRRRAVVVPRLVALCVKGGPLGIQGTDWLEDTREKYRKSTNIKKYTLSPF